jgi:hypothetical protein
MKLSRVLIALLFAACGGNSAPAPHDPADRPPLPPASGTPIGYLIDGAGELHLRDDQVTRLKQIDTTLAGELDTIDTQLRSATARPADASPPPQPMGMSGRGRHGGGMGGRGGHHRGGGGGGAGSASALHGDPAAADRLTEERRADVKEALARAFAVLDTDQQPAAKKILEDHDVDVEDGKPAAPPAAGDDSAEPDPEPEN